MWRVAGSMHTPQATVVSCHTRNTPQAAPCALLATRATPHCAPHALHTAHSPRASRVTRRQHTPHALTSRRTRQTSFKPFATRCARAARHTPFAARRLTPRPPRRAAHHTRHTSLPRRAMPGPARTKPCASGHTMVPGIIGDLGRLPHDLGRLPHQVWPGIVVRRACPSASRGRPLPVSPDHAPLARKMAERPTAARPAGAYAHDPPHPLRSAPGRPAIPARACGPWRASGGPRPPDPACCPGRLGLLSVSGRLLCLGRALGLTRSGSVRAACVWRGQVLGMIKGPEGTVVRLVLTRGPYGLSPAGPVTYVAALKRAFLPVL
jgi:hypothetical protein